MGAIQVRRDLPPAAVASRPMSRSRFSTMALVAAAIAIPLALYQGYLIAELGPDRFFGVPWPKAPRSMHPIFGYGLNVLLALAAAVLGARSRGHDDGGRSLRPLLVAAATLAAVSGLWLLSCAASGHGWVLAGAVWLMAAGLARGAWSRSPRQGVPPRSW